MRVQLLDLIKYAVRPLDQGVKCGCVLDDADATVSVLNGRILFEEVS